MREFTRIFGSVPRHCPTEKAAPFFTTRNRDAHFPKTQILRDELKLELLMWLTLLAQENSLSELSNRDNIPQAEDQMLLGNTENKASLSFPFTSWELPNEAEKRQTDPWHVGWRKKNEKDRYSSSSLKMIFNVMCQGNSGTLQLKTLSLS